MCKIEYHTVLEKRKSCLYNNLNEPKGHYAQQNKSKTDKECMTMAIYGPFKKWTHRSKKQNGGCQLPNGRCQSKSNIVQINVANLIPITVTIANNIVLNN